MTGLVVVPPLFIIIAELVAGRRARPQVLPWNNLADRPPREQDLVAILSNLLDDHVVVEAVSAEFAAQLRARGDGLLITIVVVAVLRVVALLLLALALLGGVRVAQVLDREFRALPVVAKFRKQDLVARLRHLFDHDVVVLAIIRLPAEQLGAFNNFLDEVALVVAGARVVLGGVVAQVLPRQFFSFIIFRE